MKKSPTGPALTKDPLKNKSGINSNNKAFTFIADSKNRPLRVKGKRIFPRGAGTTLRTQPKLQPCFFDMVSDAAVTQLRDDASDVHVNR